MAAASSSAACATAAARAAGSLRRRPQTAWGRGRHGGRRQVAVDLEVDGFAPAERSGDRPVDYRGGIVQAADGERPGRHVLVDLPLVVVADLAEAVVDDVPVGLRVAVDPAGDGDHRQILRVRAGHGVERAEPADAVRHHERPIPLDRAYPSAA